MPYNVSKPIFLHLKTSRALEQMYLNFMAEGLNDLKRCTQANYSIVIIVIFFE